MCSLFWISLPTAATSPNICGEHKRSPPFFLISVPFEYILPCFVGDSETSNVTLPTVDNITFPQQSRKEKGSNLDN